MKKLILTALILLMSLGIANAWTTHPLRAAKDGGDDWRITSMPKGIFDDPVFQGMSKFGALSTLHIARTDGKWDKKPMITGYWMFPKGYIENAFRDIKSLMGTFDKILPKEKVIVICYWADFQEISIYFAPKRWKGWSGKRFNHKVAKKMNKEREKYIESKPKEQSPKPKELSV